MHARIVVADVGSVRPPSKFAWAAFDSPASDPFTTGDNPETAVSVLLDGLGATSGAAFLLESPAAVPVPSPETGWRGLGKARDGEGNRPWSAGAGTGALATGLAQGAWILGELGSRIPELGVTTQAASWLDGSARLLLAEAFVSGAGKPVPVSAAIGQHAADATAVGKEFVRRLLAGELNSDVRCYPQRALNLLAAMAIWAGLHIDHGELSQDVLVVKLLPVLKA